MSFGSSMKLTEEWDFDVNTAGDISTVNDIDELLKDISFRLAVNLEREVGRPLTKQTYKRVEVLARNVLLSDPRISRVRNVTVTEDVFEADTIEVEIRAIATNDTEINRVITV